MNEKQTKADIAIIGAGAIGQAIKAALNSDCNILMWDIRIGIVPDQQDLKDLIPKSDIVFLCVPSSGFRETVNTIKGYRKSGSAIISLTKGIESNTGEMIHDILSQTFPEDFYALLSGPMLAEEVQAGKGAVAMVASKNSKIYQKLNNLFKKDYLKLEYTDNIYSVAHAGILKNVYALLIGIVDGLGYGNNIKGYFIGQILSELKLVAGQLRLDEQIVFGVAGADDFIATAISPYSLNQEAGKKIALNQAPPQSEGLTSLPHILKMLTEPGKLNILQLLEMIIIKKEDPKTVIYDYLYSR